MIKKNYPIYLYLLFIGNPFPSSLTNKLVDRCIVHCTLE
nr:MAG TPA: hypothetical protein [Caudoviricetes sp.]